MRVLITGVSGFVGRRLKEVLTAAGHAVGGTFIEEEAPELGIELFRADLLDPDALVEACERFRPDRVVHMAGLSHVGSSFDRADLYRQVNAGGTANVVAAAGDTPVVLASSSEVYGRVPEEEQPISEIREPAPLSPYAESKVLSETVVLEAGGRVVRCFNVIGPGQHPSFAMPTFAAQLADVERGTREPVLNVGNLEVWRDFVPLDDAIDGYVTLLERGEAGAVYNLGTGKATSLRELVDRLIAVSGLEVEIRVDPERFRPADAPKLFADSGRLCALGWEPKGDLDDVLAQLWSEARSRLGSRGD